MHTLTTTYTNLGHELGAQLLRRRRRQLLEQRLISYWAHHREAVALREKVSEHATDAVLGLDLLCEARHGLQKRKEILKSQSPSLILYNAQTNALNFQNLCLQRALKVLL
jgi:hypothetical protein